MKEKIKVHVADDHMVLIEGIIAMVNTDDAIEVIGYSQTGTKVLEWFKDNKADVLILDVNMPEKDGIEVLKSLNAKDQKPKIIMLSSFDDIRFVKELTTFGADGFVAKTSAGDHIIKAIKSVYNGQSYFNDEVKEGLFNLFVGQDVPKGQRPNEAAEKIRTLTERELDVLKMIAKEYSTTEIAEALHISIYTVGSYRKNLLKKLNIKNVVGLALFAVKNKII